MMIDSIAEKCKAAKRSAPYMAALSTCDKNAMISAVSDAILINEDRIIEANRKDMIVAKEKPAHFLDRLSLNHERLVSISESIKKLIALPDPIGETISEWDTEKSNLHIKKVRTPIGVLGLIYEARPNVTVDAVCLSIKTGNTIVLRGSKDAINTNIELVNIIHEVLKSNGYDENIVQLIEDVSHEGADLFMKQHDYVDVLLPRGSAAFIKNVVANATIPVIETGAGNCHVYVEKSADIKKATDIILNGKLSRPSVCNAVESLLIDEKVADDLLPIIAKALSEHGVEIRGCEKTRKIWSQAKALTEDDLYKEYGNLTISIKVIENVEQAIKHINTYGTHHSDAIITEDAEAARKFLSGVDSAAVYHNASTRFTDGYEFGFGAEMGISTQKLHARGPMGLTELTSYKYLIFGNGQIRI